MTYIVITMPLDEHMKGPADPQNTILTQWEIWDEVCQTVGIFYHPEVAKHICSLLNKEPLPDGQSYRMSQSAARGLKIDVPAEARKRQNNKGNRKHKNNSDIFI